MKKNPLKQFRLETIKRAGAYKKNKALQKAWQSLHKQIVSVKYAYNFFWFGVPIIQAPQDLQAMQEIIWEVKPDLIIETGIAWGGSILFNVSMLTLLEVCGKIKNGEVVGIDIDIRAYNKKNILAHPLSKKITMIEGSSINEKIIQKVSQLARKKKRIMVLLDSNHTHEHVLAELKAYAPLVSLGSYIVVQDTGVEDLPAGSTSDRPWKKGSNPKTAVWEFLKNNKNFKIDTVIESKLILTSSPDGFLKRIK